MRRFLKDWNRIENEVAFFSVAGLGDLTLCFLWNHFILILGGAKHSEPYPVASLPSLWGNNGTMSHSTGINGGWGHYLKLRNLFSFVLVFSQAKSLDGAFPLECHDILRQNKYLYWDLSLRQCAATEQQRLDDEKVTKMGVACVSYSRHNTLSVMLKVADIPPLCAHCILWDAFQMKILLKQNPCEGTQSLLHTGDNTGSLSPFHASTANNAHTTWAEAERQRAMAGILWWPACSNSDTLADIILQAQRKQRFQRCLPIEPLLSTL